MVSGQKSVVNGNIPRLSCRWTEEFVEFLKRRPAGAQGCPVVEDDSMLSQCALRVKYATVRHGESLIRNRRYSYKDHESRAQAAAELIHSFHRGRFTYSQRVG